MPTRSRHSSAILRRSRALDASHPKAVFHVFEHRGGKHDGVLFHQHHLPAKTPQRLLTPVHKLPPEQDLPCSRRPQEGEDVEKGGFSAAVGPEQSMAAALGEGQMLDVQHGAPIENLLQAF
jgi:hypothetical protein